MKEKNKQAFIRVTAALAAAISLLEGGGKKGTRGSPISLRKFIESGMATTQFTVLVDGTPERVGVAADDPNTVNVLVSDREFQATWFLEQNISLPKYLRKYLTLLYGEGADIDGLYAHAKTNKATRQMIGLIQILAGGLNMARKAGKGIRFYVEEPETFQHPQQQARVMDVIKKLMDEYGPKEEPQQAESAK